MNETTYNKYINHLHEQEVNSILDENHESYEAEMLELIDDEEMNEVLELSARAQFEATAKAIEEM